MVYDWHEDRYILHVNVDVVSKTTCHATSRFDQQLAMSWHDPSTHDYEVCQL